MGKKEGRKEEGMKKERKERKGEWVMKRRKDAKGENENKEDWKE